MLAISYEINNFIFLYDFRTNASNTGLKSMRQNLENTLSRWNHQLILKITSGEK